MGTLALHSQIINRSEWLLRHWFTTEVDHESGGIWPLLDPRCSHGSRGRLTGRQERVRRPQPELDG